MEQHVAKASCACAKASLSVFCTYWNADHTSTIHADVGACPGDGRGGEQTAYLQCIINAASIRQRLDEGGVGVLIGLHAAAARVKNASIACTAPQVINMVVLM